MIQNNKSALLIIFIGFIISILFTTNNLDKYDKNLKRDIYRIYEERKDFYGLADYKINCNRLNKIQIVNKIVEIYENL